MEQLRVVQVRVERVETNLKTMVKQKFSEISLTVNQVKELLHVATFYSQMQQNLIRKLVQTYGMEPGLVFGP